MGVTGCGKSTVGRLLAQNLGIPFFDADDFHPANNIEKMSQGIPLTDEDRLPWLETLRNLLHTENAGCVLACSALKQKYRDILQSSETKFVYLKADKSLIINRLRARKDHYMPSSLIDSQFKALEEPRDAMVVDASHSIEEIGKQTLLLIGENRNDH